MRYFRVYIIVFVFIYATLWSQEKVSVSTFNPLAKSMHFTSGGKDTVLVLQHHFLFQGSVKVLFDSVLL
ncbi:hypothetical protein KA005_71215, partial [bacterium]|nr:hypothetical protein [bacterium]